MFQSFAEEDKTNQDVPIQDELHGENQMNIDKYKSAGIIAETALIFAKRLVSPGIKIVDICTQTDTYIADNLKQVYVDKVFEKGLAFPTSVSVNHTIGFNSPLTDDDSVISHGDLVNIELGVHIDGFPVIVCETMMVGDPSEKQQQVMECLRDIKRSIKTLVKIGKDGNGVHAMMTEMTEKHGCNLIDCDESIAICPGIFSYQVSQEIIHGRNDVDEDYEKHSRMFMGKNRHEYDDLENVEFEHNQVFIIDVAVSSGTGRVNVNNLRETTIYKHDFDHYHALKRDASKLTLVAFKNKGVFPTNIREIDCPVVRMGLRECISTGVLDMYPVMYEKNGEFIGRYKYTVIIRNGNAKKKNRNICFN
jgi:methionine aminopeptidase